MTQNKKIIAITGGIGSGKSAVSKIITDLGYLVLSCDKIYSQLLNLGHFNAEFKNEFGNVFNNDGTLNKNKLANIVFSDENKLRTLNNITHPKIMEEVLRRANEHYSNCFVEVPLLFECNLQDKFDEVIVVTRSLKNRIKSVVNRDNISVNDVILRINNQFNYDSADFSPYFVVNNDGSLQELKEKISKLIKNIIIKFKNGRRC